MVEKKKLLGSLCILSCIVNASPVTAADNNDALLVKVHDVKPIKNEKGITTNCEFTTTIYNRSSSDISELNIELNWFDEAAKDTIQQEKNMDNGNMRRTQDFISSDVRSTISIPVLKKSTQKSIQSKLNSERCFMLLEDAKINVKSCKSGGTSRKETVSCEALFQFISSKSPEYYTEFLNISLDTQKEEDKKEREKISKELDDIFEKLEDNMKKTSRILTTTFAPVAPLPSAAITIPNATPAAKDPEPINAKEAKEKVEPKPTPVITNK